VGFLLCDWLLFWRGIILSKMNTSVRNGLFVGVGVLLLIVAGTFYFLNKPTEISKKDWVEISKSGNLQEIKIPSKNINFTANANWVTSYGSENSEIKIISKLSNVEVSEGFFDGCMLQFYVRNQKTTPEEFINTLKDDEKLFAYGDENFSSKYNLEDVGGRKVLVHNLDIEKWGLSRTIYIFGEKTVYSFSMNYGKKDKDYCISELYKTVNSFKF
jgi:hypothetical protein